MKNAVSVREGVSTRPRIRRGWLNALSVALAGATLVAPAPAMAEPVADAPPPPPAAVPVPSAEPATGKSADGWTLAVSANSETLTPVPPLTPELATRDFVVSGLFNGTLRSPNGGTAPTPSGTLEVGYQIQCVPSGMLAALKPAVTNVQVSKEEFQSANPSAVVSDYRIQVDCMGPALVRSYAILTRSTHSNDAVVAYYGISNEV